jgi:hypothetical protein
MIINKDWHEKNRMKKNPSFNERVLWHLSHAENCPCRGMSESIKKEIERRKQS